MVRPEFPEVNIQSHSQGDLISISTETLYFIGSHWGSFVVHRHSQRMLHALEQLLNGRWFSWRTQSWVLRLHRQRPGILVPNARMTISQSDPAFVNLCSRWAI